MAAYMGPLARSLLLIVAAMTFTGCRSRSESSENGFDPETEHRLEGDVYSGDPEAEFPWVACSPDGTHIAAGGETRLYLMNVTTGHRESLWEAGPPAPPAPQYNPGGMKGLAFAGNAKYLAVRVMSGGVHVWDLTKRSVVFESGKREGAIRDLAFSPTSKELYASEGSPGDLVRRMELATGKARVVYRAAESKVVAPWPHANIIFSIGISPDGKTLAIGVREGTVLFDLETEKERAGLPTKECAAGAIAFSPDGRAVATAVDELRLWNAQSGALIKTFDRPALRDGSGGTARGVVFSSDGLLIATVLVRHVKTESHVALWRVSDGKLLAHFPCHYGDIAGYGFAGQSYKLITAGKDGKVRVWNLAPFAAESKVGHDK